MQIRLEGFAQRAVAAQQQPDGNAGDAADDDRHANFGGSCAEVRVQVRLREQRDERAPDFFEPRHDVAKQPSRHRHRLPQSEKYDDDRHAHARDPTDAEVRNRTHRTRPSHRSILSVSRKNPTLTRITKKIAAYIAGRS